ncbi:MAG: hypothetical protein WBB23_23505 [Desulforhopalus sp.]
MFSYGKVLVTCIFVISLLTYPLYALAENIQPVSAEKHNSPEAMIVDIIAARPIGLVATITGTVVFVVSLPFSALGGNTGEAWDSLVVSPAKYTFRRPLGEYEEPAISTDF